MRLLTTLGVVVLVAAALTGFLLAGTDDNSGTSAGSSHVQPGEIACGSGAIAGAGSTFAKNIELQWIQDYARACPRAPVNYNATGSGAGIQSFTDRQVDYAGSDTVMKSDEQAKANARCSPHTAAIHLPIAAGALVFAYDLPGVNRLRLSPGTVAGIFTGAISRWDDPRLAADNPGVRLPRIPVQAVHRSDSSGTTDSVSRYLAATAGGAWTLGTGKELRWPGGLASKGSDGVTGAIRSTPGAITYLEQSFAVVNQLEVALLRNGAGEYLPPAPAAVSRSLAAARIDRSRGDLRVDIDYRTSLPGVYPATAVTYAIVCQRGNRDAAAVRAFLSYAVQRGQQSADPLGYAALPPVVADQLTPLVASIA